MKEKRSYQRHHWPEKVVVKTFPGLKIRDVCEIINLTPKRHKKEHIKTPEHLELAKAVVEMQPGREYSFRIIPKNAVDKLREIGVK